MVFLNDFFSAIDYDVIELYSYNRGELLRKHLEDLQAEKHQLLEEMELEEDKDKELELNKRVKAIDSYDPFHDHILNEYNKLHPTAQLIGKFKKEEQIAIELNRIFSRKMVDPISLRCGEELRDGVVFKKDGNIKEALSICFTCQTVRTSDGGKLGCDMQFYDSYKSLLHHLGHDVELI